jgi:hypothetical protein
VTTSTTLSSTLEDSDPNILLYSGTPWIDQSSAFHSSFSLEQEWAAVECLDDAEESRMQVDFVERTAKEMQDIVQYWYRHASMLATDDPLQNNTLWSLYHDDHQEAENDMPFGCEGENNCSEAIEHLFQSIVPMKLQSCRGDEEEEDCLPLELLNELYDAESMRRWQILQYRHVQFDEHGEGCNVSRRCYNVLALLLLFSSLMIVSQVLAILHGVCLALIGFAGVQEAIPPDSVEVALALLVVLIG